MVFTFWRIMPYARQQPNRLVLEPACSFPQPRRTTMGQLGHKQSFQRSPDQAVKTTFYPGDSKDDQFWRELAQNIRILKVFELVGDVEDWVRCVLGCLFVILDREGLWPVLLRNLTKTTGADNVRKVEAAARSKGSQRKEQVHCTRPQCLLQCFFEWK